MTFQVPENQHHVADLLPAYVNETLDHLSADRVHQHLSDCEACQLELLSWQAMQYTTQFVAASAPLPSASVLESALARIDAPAQTISTGQSAISRLALHLWLVFKRQIPLIPKSVWVASVLVVTFGCLVAMLSSRNLQEASLILALFTSVVGGTGVAFIYGSEHDFGFEITLSTPTSIRIIMLCRTAIVLGYTIALSALASAVVAFSHGGGLWQVIQLWLGPLILLTSVSLILTMLIGSAVAVIVSVVLEVIQALPLDIEKGIVSLQLVRSTLWQTNLPILLAAVLLIIAGVLYAPRQPRLSN